MMLGGEDNSIETSSSGNLCPLAAIQLSGVEDVFHLSTVTPLFSREGVRSEMAEHVHFHALPLQLRLGRNGTIRGWRRRQFVFLLAGGYQQEN